MIGLHSTECSVCLCWDAESLFVGKWGYTVGCKQGSVSLLLLVGCVL